MRERLEALAAILNERGYRASVYQTAKEAAAHLQESLAGLSVGIGGSMTAEEMGLESLLSPVCDLHWHWHAQKGKSAADELAAAANAEVYISSVNAIAESGEIVNIDGNCNRVAATMYGHRRVILIVGRNKLAASEAEAIARARNVAAPKNAARLARKTPCVVDGRCHDCKSPERICRALSVLWCAPRGPEYEILLINEDLGY